MEKDGYDPDKPSNAGLEKPEDPEAESPDPGDIGKVISITRWQLQLLLHEDEKTAPALSDRVSDGDPQKSAENGENVLELANHREAYAMLPRIYELYNSGEVEEARRLASGILKKYPITAALKLLLESDLTLGEKTFCRAMEAYLKHLRLSKKKKRNFPIDRRFLETIFDTAIERGFFKPVPSDFIPSQLRGLNVLQLMIKMSEVKKELHLHAELLTSLYLKLKERNEDAPL